MWLNCANFNEVNGVNSPEDAGSRKQPTMTNRGNVGLDDIGFCRTPMALHAAAGSRLRILTRL